jgi:hypothetical protein
VRQKTATTLASSIDTIAPMIPTALDEQYDVRVNLRPLKYTFFVKSDDEAALRNAIVWAGTHWGGLGAQIFPFREGAQSGPLTQLLEVSEPDTFVTMIDDVATNKRVTEFLQTRWRHRRVKLIDRATYEARDPAAHILTIPRNGNEPLTAHSFASGGNALEELVLLSTFGQLNPTHVEDYAKDIVIEKRDIAFSDADYWEAASRIAPMDSVLNFTTSGVNGYWIKNPRVTNIIDLCVGDSVEGICLFWNGRSVRESAYASRERSELGRRSLLIPPAVLADSNETKRFIDFLRKRIPVPGYSTNLHLNILTWDEQGHKAITDALSAAEGTKKFSGKTIQPREGANPETGVLLIDDVSSNPIVFGGAWLMPGEVREGVGRWRDQTRTALREGDNEVATAFPEGFDRAMGAVAMDVESDVWARYPRSIRTGQRVQPNARFSHYGATIAGYTDPTSRRVAVALPTELQALQDFFAERGFDARISQGGRALAALVQKIGGLENVATFANELAFKTVTSLALLSRKKLAQRLTREHGLNAEDADARASTVPLETLREVSPPRTFADIKGAVGATDPKELIEHLQALAERNVLRRGFWIQCGSCSLNSWYPIDGIGPTLTCPGCTTSFTFPVEYPPGSATEIRWTYTLNTLVDTVMDQDGLPAALALYALTRQNAAACLCAGLEMIPNGDAQPKAEFDIVLVVDQDVWAGECKAGSSLAAKDIDRARFASSVGIERFFFCTTSASGFDESSVSAIKDLNKELKREAEGNRFAETINRSKLLVGESRRARRNLGFGMTRTIG